MRSGRQSRQVDHPPILPASLKERLYHLMPEVQVIPRWIAEPRQSVPVDEIQELADRPQ